MRHVARLNQNTQPNWLPTLLAVLAYVVIGPASALGQGAFFEIPDANNADYFANQGSDQPGAVLNNVGHIAFTKSNNEELWFFDGVTSTQIASDGDSVGNGTFKRLGVGLLNSNIIYPSMAMDDNDNIYFMATLQQTAGSETDDEGLYRFDGTGITELAREGSSRPGGGVSVSYTHLTLPTTPYV